MHGDRHSGATEGHLESFGDGACHVLEGPLPSVTVLPRIKATSLFAVSDVDGALAARFSPCSKALHASQLSFLRRSASLQDFACIAPH